MKAKFIKGTTWRGQLVNAGDVLDLDEKDYNNFVNVWKDAVPYVEKAETAPTPAPTEVHKVKKGKE